MNNYPVVLRNYLFLMGIFATLPNDSEGTRTVCSISHCCKLGIFLFFISNDLNLSIFSEKLSARDPLVNFYMLTS